MVGSMSEPENSDWAKPSSREVGGGGSETVIDADTARHDPQTAVTVAKIKALRQSIDNVDTAIVSCSRSGSAHVPGGRTQGAGRIRAGGLQARGLPDRTAAPHRHRRRTRSRHRGNVPGIRGSRGQEAASAHRRRGRIPACSTCSPDRRRFAALPASSVACICMPVFGMRAA